MPPQQTQPEFFTKTISCFVNGNTTFPIGTLDSGYYKYPGGWGLSSVAEPPSFSFLEAPVLVSSTDLTTSDLIVAGRVRVESGVTYLYCVASTGKLFKIQVNDITNTSPTKDTITLLTTLTAGSATFKYGASMTFGTISGTTEGIYIGHDTGLTKVAFDGTGETFIGSTDSTHWIANVPRYVVPFGQYLYYTNGYNIAEYSLASLTVTSYFKLSPGFPINYQIRDIDCTGDGRYIVLCVSRNSQIDLTSATLNTSEAGSVDSIIAYWNGTDTAISSFSSIPAFSISAYHTFNSHEFSFGSDVLGGCVNIPLEKELSMYFCDSPTTNSVASTGNMLGWFCTQYDSNTYQRKAALMIYGKIDKNWPQGLYQEIKMAATSPQTDVVRVPFGLLATGTNWAAYYKLPGFLFANGSAYFSTVESNGTATAYRFYRFSEFAAGLETTMTNAQIETQTEIFSKKVKVKEIRFFIKPTAGTSFKSELTGADLAVIANSDKTFTPLATDDMVKYNPTSREQGALALRITNLGTSTTSPLFRKIELDLITVNA